MWKRANESIENGCIFMDVWLHKNNCCHKKKEIDMNEAVRVPLRKRGTLRFTTQALKIPKFTLLNYIQCGEILWHSNTVKPHLTLANMIEREDFCKYFIKDDKRTFDDMLDVIHVDGKWFYMTKNTKKFYLGMQELEPHRTTRSKLFSTKVIFLAAVACPRCVGYHRY